MLSNHQALYLFPTLVINSYNLKKVTFFIFIFFFFLLLLIIFKESDCTDSLFIDTVDECCAKLSESDLLNPQDPSVQIMLGLLSFFLFLSFFLLPFCSSYSLWLPSFIVSSRLFLQQEHSHSNGNTRFPCFWKNSKKAPETLHLVIQCLSNFQNLIGLVVSSCCFSIYLSILQ